ncbi:NAD-dependent epimerase/dehydratase family protein [Microbacterium paraoxydans]|uniref:NAD-dependent epimerase/dehydratase family protein n=1 Tax=Microbacterium paraoxydans TaxID=199592 RepID=UPI001CFA03B0|nr:NAD-dependent epimerase/dehydratase family protein [Microbacterium paraoxydans]
MTVLITGGAGFIGSNLARHINRVSPDTEVRVFDDLSTGRRDNLEGVRAEFVEGSLTDVDAVVAAADGVTAIAHLGALGSVPRSVDNPLGSHDANLTGTLNLLEAARSHGAYVTFASSSSVYGANTTLPKSEFDWTRPMSPYAVTKLGAEAYVLAYSHSYGLPTLAFRFFNVYGPYQPADHAYAAVIPRFLDAALSGRPAVIHGDGQQSRDFTHVDTVCQTLWSAIERRLDLPDPVNLAFGTRTTLLELLDVMEDELGQPIARTHVEPRAGDVRASQSDGVRLREFFPDVASTPLREGIASTVDWFRRTTAP